MVTLVPNPVGEVLGAAFEVEPAVYEHVMAKLDHREKGGYERVHTVATSSLGPLNVITYVGSPSNPNYAGPAPIDEIATTIAASVGPSGANIEYLVELSEALRRRGERDEHVEALRAAVERLG
ncbi:MAG: cation transport regulator ChaC [Bradymonadia bacterium]